MRVRGVLVGVGEEGQEPRRCETTWINSFSLEMLREIRQAYVQQPVVLIEQQLEPLKFLGEQPLEVVLHQG